MIGPPYRTIVADPPWPYPEGFARSIPTGKSLNVKRDGDRAVVGKFQRKTLPYKAMTIPAITALPLRELSDESCRLFCWTTNKWIAQTFDIIAAWGFIYKQTLVWEKAEGGPFITSVAPNTVEFVIVAAKGDPERTGSFSSQVFKYPAIRNHSTKPEAFLDIVESVSPGPYLEMFARRQRLGWDTWGDEALNHVSLGAHGD